MTSSGALSKMALIVVIALIITASFVGVYLSGLIHLSSRSHFVKLIGLCQATSYEWPDTTEQTSTTNVTTTAGGTITYYASTITIPNTPYVRSTTYTVTTHVNSSTTYMTTNSTGSLNVFEWYDVVTTCTFAP